MTRGEIIHVINTILNKCKSEEALKRILYEVIQLAR